ncbi:MAG: hypothetical protein KA473_15815 [Anaerolineales bacterium]|nr:hypothetical protein [Anaerolineales bacterium]MBP6210898.1 hypothetical protein [Anaerolineales bacterium]
MSKKVVFNGIEILTEESDASAHDLLGFIESVIDKLETNLDDQDENFHLSVNMDFHPKKPLKHTFSVTNLFSKKTRQKVVSVLKSTAKTDNMGILGSVHIDFQVEDK